MRVRSSVPRDRHSVDRPAGADIHHRQVLDPLVRLLGQNREVAREAVVVERDALNGTAEESAQRMG